MWEPFNPKVSVKDFDPNRTEIFLWDGPSPFGLIAANGPHVFSQDSGMYRVTPYQETPYCSTFKFERRVADEKEDSIKEMTNA